MPASASVLRVLASTSTGWASFGLCRRYGSGASRKRWSFAFDAKQYMKPRKWHAKAQLPWTNTPSSFRVTGQTPSHGDRARPASCSAVLWMSASCASPSGPGSIPSSWSAGTLGSSGATDGVMPRRSYRKATHSAGSSNEATSTRRSRAAQWSTMGLSDGRSAAMSCGSSPVTKRPASSCRLSSATSLRRSTAAAAAAARAAICSGSSGLPSSSSCSGGCSSSSSGSSESTPPASMKALSSSVGSISPASIFACRSILAWRAALRSALAAAAASLAATASASCCRRASSSS
mmetsp:Transcript_36091/g.111226  ORF Transcript_36091/g.111226 Transcript_36091/m.111226 type:complete len:291 (+) Transcript_36091:222-1094(+)